MALVKKSKMAAGTGKPQLQPPMVVEASARPRPAARGRVRAAAGSRIEKASERVAAATEELASGLSESSAAAEELRRSMEQIAAGAEEAAGASQEQLAAVKSIAASLTAARNEADASRRNTDNLQLVLAETALQITACVRSIEKNAARQQSSMTVIAELERRARDIGEITGTVSRISDQTNLLALNAAIEAARAGDHGRGFAVVAEEVRALAETSEKSAQDVQGLSRTIEERVGIVARAVTAAADKAVSEAKAGGAAVDSLGSLRRDMGQMAEGSESTLTAAVEAERAAGEVQRSAEQVAGAAEEQAAAAGQAQSGIGEQAKSLDQAQVAARTLAALAEDIRAGRAPDSAAEQIGAAAEELSATIQELSGTATEINAAVDQINRGSQQQAAAAQQAATALGQIEKSARAAQDNAKGALERVGRVETALKESRGTMDSLIGGVGVALQETRASLALIAELDGVGRRIDKIVDRIALVAVQTGMLAVSGAVEAARAGDSGRGFAVVSNDIRSLAREASESSDRIKDTVRGIIDQIASMRHDLEQIIASVESEVEKNRLIVGSLERLDADVATLAAANGAILSGAGSILASTAEAAAGARQIAAAADEASAGSRQAATASGQQAQGAEDLAAAIEEIASLADELKKPNG